MKYIKKIYESYGIIPFLLCAILTLLQENGYISLLSLFCVLSFFIIPRKIYKSSTYSLILFFSLVYACFSFYSGALNNLSSFLNNIFPLIFFYAIGAFLAAKTYNDDDLLFILCCILATYSSCYYLSTIYDIAMSGELINPLREYAFQQDLQEKYNSTHVGTTIAPGFVGLVAFFAIKKQNKVRWFYLILFILSLLTTVHLVNRSGVIEAFVAVLLMVYYVLRSKSLSVLQIIVYSLIVILILSYLGIFNNEVIEFYSQRNDESSLATAGLRSNRWVDACANVFVEPFGWWTHSNSGYYIHNMWLDIAKVAGIIPFTTLVLLTIKSTSKSLNLIKNYFTPLTFIIFSLNVFFFLSCFIEPVLGETHLALYMMIWGVQEKLFKNIL